MRQFASNPSFDKGFRSKTSTQNRGLVRRYWSNFEIIADDGSINKATLVGAAKGLSHIDWWRGLKLRRAGGKSITLQDKSGRHFTLTTVDPLPEWMHHTGSSCRRNV